MAMKTAADFDPDVLILFDAYVHGAQGGGSAGVVAHGRPLQLGPADVVESRCPE